jgi:hypothetical protein
LNNLTGENILLSRLSVHEQHAQAAVIIGIAERLEDRACREYIAAPFGGMTKPEHATIMTNRIFVELGTGIHGRRGAYNCCSVILGANIGYRADRYHLKCRDAVLIEVRWKIYDALDVIGHKAMVEMVEELERRALVELVDKTDGRYTKQRP